MKTNIPLTITFVIATVCGLVQATPVHTDEQLDSLIPLGLQGWDFKDPRGRTVPLSEHYNADILSRLNQDEYHSVDRYIHAGKTGGQGNYVQDKGLENYKALPKQEILRRQPFVHQNAFVEAAQAWQKMHALGGWLGPLGQSSRAAAAVRHEHHPVENPYAGMYGHHVYQYNHPYFNHYQAKGPGSQTRPHQEDEATSAHHHDLDLELRLAPPGHPRHFP